MTDEQIYRDGYKAGLAHDLGSPHPFELVHHSWGQGYRDAQRDKADSLPMDVVLANVALLNTVADRDAPANLTPHAAPVRLVCKNTLPR